VPDREAVGSARQRPRGKRGRCGRKGVPVNSKTVGDAVKVANGLAVRVAVSVADREAVGVKVSVTDGKPVCVAISGRQCTSQSRWPTGAQRIAVSERQCASQSQGGGARRSLSG
jgi:hypothetical protein